MILSDKRVLFTGATGLIGQEVIKPLVDNGFDVYAVSRNNVPGYANWIKADIFNVRCKTTIFIEYGMVYNW